MKKPLFYIFSLLFILFVSYGKAYCDTEYGPESRGDMIPEFIGTNDSGQSTYMTPGPDTGIVWHMPLNATAGVTGIGTGVVDNSSGVTTYETVHGISMAHFSTAISGKPKSPIADMLDSDIFAESLGGELVTNGDMEINGNWTDYVSPVESGQTTGQVHGGSNSWYFLSDGFDGITSDAFTTETDKTYKFTAWIYSDNTTQINIRFRSGGDASNLTDGGMTVTQDSWTEITRYYKETDGGSGAYIRFSGQAGSALYYIDDVSVKNVTNPSPAGGPPSGLAMVTWRPGFDYNGAGVPASVGILSASGVASLLYHDGDGDIKSYDGTTTTEYTDLNWTANKTYNLYAVWGLKSELPTSTQAGLTDNVAYYVVGIDDGSGISYGIPSAWDGAFATGTDLQLYYTGYGSVHMTTPTILSLGAIGDINSFLAQLPHP